MQYVKEMRYHLPKREYKYLISVVNPYETTIDDAIDTLEEIVRSTKRNKKAMVAFDELRNYKRTQDAKKAKKLNKHTRKSNEKGSEGSSETDH